MQELANGIFEANILHQMAGEKQVFAVHRKAGLLIRGHAGEIFSVTVVYNYQYFWLSIKGREMNLLQLLH